MSVSILYKISVDTVVLLCYTRMRVIYNNVYSANLVIVVLLHFVTICYNLSIDNPVGRGHNGNHGKAIKPDHPASQAS